MLIIIKKNLSLEQMFVLIGEREREKLSNIVIIRGKKEKCLVIWVDGKPQVCNLKATHFEMFFQQLRGLPPNYILILAFTKTKMFISSTEFHQL